MTTDFTGGPDFAAGVAAQPDGKIVAAGVANNNFSKNAQFALARYETDGSLDTSFGGDGRVLTNFTSGYDGAFDVAIQDDGKIVAVGRAGGSGGRFALARYKADGTLDSSFGGDGKVATNITPALDFAFDLVIQPADQKIVAGGRASGSGGRFALARYNTNGTLDTSFDGDGRVTTDFTAGYDIIDALAFQPDGLTIVAVGTANGANPKWALARYHSDGSLDVSFDGDGKVTTSFPPASSWGFAVAIQPADGDIVAAGQVGSNMGVARYEDEFPSAGELDTTFGGGDGKVITSFTSGTDYADDVAVQPDDGKILALGSANYFGANPMFALARYEPNGSLDTTFGGDGKVTTNLTPKRDHAYGLLVQDDGAIVAAGVAGYEGPNAKFALARYLGA